MKIHCSSELVAVFAVLLLAGCGEPKNDSTIKALAEKRNAETMARMETARERTEAAVTAERNPVLEAKATEIEEAFVKAGNTVEAARKATDEPEEGRESSEIVRVDARHGFYSKIVTRSLSPFWEDEIAPETTVYSVRLPDGTAWTAEVIRENGIVTKAAMKVRD